MQSKKQINNPEAPLFNIRKVNKKIITLGKNIVAFNSEKNEDDMIFHNYSSVNKATDTRKEKEILLDQSVNQAIINSKVYLDLKRAYMESKRKNTEQRKLLQQEIEVKKKQKIQALQERQKLQKQKQKYLQTIKQIKQKLQAVRQANQKYRQSLNNRMSGEADYISNLIMSMRFQAEYEHGIDPDQMTYQELIELGEKIGVVSKGLPTELIQILPKTEVQTTNDQRCTICFSNYQIGEISTIIPNCKHQFHFQCIQSWLAKQKVCPICKQQIQFTNTS